MTTTTWRDWSCRVDLTLDGGARMHARGTGLVRDLMDEVARAVSRFDPASDIERVNAAAGSRVLVRPLTVTLVRLGLVAARSTAGAVDPTVGAALLAAGYDADIDDVRRRRPGPAAATVAVAGWSKVRLDESLGLVGVPRGVRLDLGATAKAWTADEAARRVSADLGVSVLVGIGGDVATGGTSRRPWDVRVGERETGPGQQVALSFGGVATSSTVVRSWWTATGRAHHVIDPATGRPVEGPYRTASVWSTSCLAANVLSTGALVWGAAAPDHLAAHGAAARLVGATGHVTTIGDWPNEDVAA